MCLGSAGGGVFPCVVCGRYFEQRWLVYRTCLTNDEEVYAARRIRWVSVDSRQQQQFRIDVESGCGRRRRNNLVGTFPGGKGGRGCYVSGNDNYTVRSAI